MRYIIMRYVLIERPRLHTLTPDRHENREYDRARSVESRGGRPPV